MARCWSHGRRKLIKAKPKKGSPIVDEALLRIAALYKIEDAIRGATRITAEPSGRSCPARWSMSSSHGWPPSPHGSRANQTSARPWPTCCAARTASAFPGLTRRHWRHGPLQLLDDGHIDIDSNLVENAIRSPAMNRRNALFAGHDEGGRNWARFAVSGVPAPLALGLRSVMWAGWGVSHAGR